MRPKPDLSSYSGGGASDRHNGFERWRQDTLVWCAEAMQEAAERIERALAEERLDKMLGVRPEPSLPEADYMTRGRPTPGQPRRPRWRRWL